MITYKNIPPEFEQLFREFLEAWATREDGVSIAVRIDDPCIVLASDAEIDGFKTIKRLGRLTKALVGADTEISPASAADRTLLAGQVRKV